MTPGALGKLIQLLNERDIEYIVVGGMAAVLQGAPVVTADLDIVHRRTPENVEKLYQLLNDLHAVVRGDPRKLPVSKVALMGSGHINAKTDLGPLDVLCELSPGEDYEYLFPHIISFSDGEQQIAVLGLAELINVKRRANRAKDRLVLPILIAALEELQKKRG